MLLYIYIYISTYIYIYFLWDWGCLHMSTLYAKCGEKVCDARALCQKKCIIWVSHETSSSRDVLASHLLIPSNWSFWHDNFAKSLSMCIQSTDGSDIYIYIYTYIFIHIWYYIIPFMIYTYVYIYIYIHAYMCQYIIVIAFGIWFGSSYSTVLVSPARCTCEAGAGGAVPTGHGTGISGFIYLLGVKSPYYPLVI